MIHRMINPIEFFRAQVEIGDRNAVVTTNASIGIIKVNLRNVESEYTANSTEPVEWKYKATLSTRKNEDIRIDDTFEIEGYGHFHVVESKQARNHRHIIAIQMKNGDEVL